MLTSESFTEPIIFHHLRFAADSIFIWTFSFLGKYYIFAQINQSFCRHICIPQICYCMVSIQSKLHAILGIIHQSTNLLFKLLLVSVFIDQTILFVLDQNGTDPIAWLATTAQPLFIDSFRTAPQPSLKSLVKR